MQQQQIDELHEAMDAYSRMVDRINARLGIDPDVDEPLKIGANFNKLYYEIDRLEKELRDAQSG
jgi:uncharacterized coiled-coil DUF342 family protein